MLRKGARMEDYEKMVKEVDEGLSKLYRALQGILESQKGIVEDVKELKRRQGGRDE